MAGLLLVALKQPVRPVEVVDQVSGEIAAAGVGGDCRPDRAQQGSGQAKRGACGDWVLQQAMETIGDPDAFVGQSSRRWASIRSSMVCFCDVGAQLAATLSDMRDAGGVVEVGLAGVAGVQHPGTDAEGA